LSNKFLTLGIGCEHEGVLGSQGKSVFSYFRLGVFTHDGNGDKKKERRRCTGGDGFDVFMSFFFIWNDYATMDIAGCWLIVWQGRIAKQRMVSRNLAEEQKDEKQQSKANKWERERFVFHLVEVFREGGWIFVSNRGTKRFVV
jgi:hypothetical protein